MTSRAYFSTFRDRRLARRRQLLSAKTQLASGRRVLMVWALLMLALLGLGGRLVYLQLLQGDALAQMAEQQRYAPTIARQARYPIVDRLDNVLAVDRVVYTLYAHPKLFKVSPAEVAAAVATQVNMPQDELLTLLNQQPSGIRVADTLTEEIGDRIRALRIDGLELVPQQQRFYPQQELFAPIVGFVNLDGEPQAGLEIAHADRLAIEPIAGLAGPDITPSAHLKLTLDSRLQRIAQQELEAVVQAHSAKRGTVMVMDASTGELLSLASVPTYDPNRYYEADISAFRNWPVSDSYEPGSTFKPVNVAIALENNVISADDMINDSGQLQFGKWLIRNHDYNYVGARGPISITDILKYSSNVGMVRIMQAMSASNYYDWLDRLTLGEPSGIDLPNEAPGQMKDREQFINSRVESATTAFGQGFAITPIKMLQLLGTLANGGKLVTPHLVDGMVSDDGAYVWQPRRPITKTVFSTATAQQVLTMMEAVVSDGTGETAHVDGYRIGGKTGTAQKASTGGYGTGRITSFVGILPVENPRYVVLAVIDEPQGDNAYGSTVAAPLVKEVIESLVVLQGLPPSLPEEVEASND
jgi:cell division protein FtsI (penicillin-binding protein 3)